MLLSYPREARRDGPKSRGIQIVPATSSASMYSHEQQDMRFAELGAGLAKVKKRLTRHLEQILFRSSSFAVIGIGMRLGAARWWVG